MTESGRGVGKEWERETIKRRMGEEKEGNVREIEVGRGWIWK